MNICQIELNYPAAWPKFNFNYIESAGKMECTSHFHCNSYYFDFSNSNNRNGY